MLFTSVYVDQQSAAYINTSLEAHLVTMLVINHCGVSNTVYHTSCFPCPYSALVEAEGSLSLDYSPVGADFATLKEAIQYSQDLKKDHRELHPWQDEFACLSTISHVVTVHDRQAGTFTVLLDGVSEY